MSSLDSNDRTSANARAAKPFAENRGKEYWRGLEEWTSSDEFQDLLRREFPEHAAQWANALTRRQFLTLMGASLALGGLVGCSPQPPVGKIMPYVRQPEGLTPGTP